MIIGKLFLPAVDGFAFLGAQHLLTVGRPEGLAANLADLLTKGVLALFGKAFLLFFCLLMGFCTVSIAKSLPDKGILKADITATIKGITGGIANYNNITDKDVADKVLAALKKMEDN